MGSIWQTRMIGSFNLAAAVLLLVAGIFELQRGETAMGMAAFFAASCVALTALPLRRRDRDR